ncbi:MULTISPECIES: suppressor of fused domain protein [unclassified Clostridium]|uniref:suppressor of fused domain protein n=1 Tax=unclassified Clostridium TaxID=2614128 RepID=UPI00207AAF82|nr:MULTISPECIES: suppressor of fused domain protein [unclassified Clostridium]
MKNILKKIFGGKSEGTSEDGTSVYRYDESLSDVDNAALTPYVEEIKKHFDKVFPERQSSTFHELISDTIHIDITIMEATEEQPFKILFTTGMSSMPMTLPDEIPEDQRELYYRSELMMFLPADWELTEQSIKNENNYWPIRLMKQMARFPHEYNTWLAYGHTVPNYETYDSYSENTGLNGVIFNMFKEEISVINTNDGNRINIYYVLPLYKQEIEYKLQNGMDALMDKLDSTDWIILNSQRENTCK